MNFSNLCSMEDAFQGKPYVKNQKPILETYHLQDKKNLLKKFDEKQVTKVNEGRQIKTYESPLIIVNEQSFIEGKFRDNPNKNTPNDPSTKYPYPFVHDEDFFDKEFIPKLKAIMHAKKKYAIPYGHLEQCRLCFKPLGNKEYVLQSKNKTFRVHDSVLHYYMRHKVWPSKELYWFIKNF